MVRFIDYLFSRIPHLEIMARIIYWRYEWFHSFSQRVKSQKNRHAKPSSTYDQGGNTASLLDVENELRKHGVTTGDILVVHSSMQSLACTGASTGEVIDMLLRVIGESGTLVMPAIPKYKEAAVVASGVARITADLTDEVWTYDVQKTVPWTGALPYKLMKTPGARRGRHPLNTIVAKGFHVNEMFALELNSSHSTPCGPESAWAFCAKHNAKIVALGCDLAHSLTMIHVAEDCHEQDWPVAGWYRERTFLVKDEEVKTKVIVRERHPKWAMHYCERKLDFDLRRNNISKASKIGNITVTSVDSAPLLKFLEDKRSKAYPYYLCWMQK